MLNLLPIPPLDGSRVVSSLLPTRQSIAYSKVEPYGFVILIILVFTGILGAMLKPLLQAGYYVLRIIFQL